MNKVFLYGNVGKDPDIKILQSGKKVAKFSLATNETYTNASGEKITETEWHNIILWEKLAETTEKWVKKGNSVIIEGKIKYRNYDNPEGQTIYITEIVGKNLTLVGKKEETQKSGKQLVGSMSDPIELGDAMNDPSYLPENYNEDNQPF